jgi:two-component system cell cycle sensor histidine kinase/response regulator CckA
MVSKRVKKETDDRRREQKILRQYERIVSTTPDPIAILDRNYRFQMVNDACLKGFGKSRDQILGKTVSEVLGSEVFKRFFKNHLDRCLNGEVITYQGWFDFLTNSRRFMIVNYYPYSDEDDGISGVVMSARDITELKLAQNDANKRQKYLESILHNAPDAIVTLDASQCVIEWNPGAEQIFGYTRDEAVGKKLGDLVARPELFTEVQTITKQVLSGKKLPPHEAIRYRKNGTPVEVIMAASPIEIEGEVQGIVVVHTDITERRLAEVRLQENEKRFRNLFEQSNDAIFLHKSGQIIDVNQRACEMLGYSKEQLLSMSIPDLHYEKDQAESKGRINAAYRRKSILFETQFVKADGTTVDVEVSSKIVDHKNKISQGIARDITERIQAQEEKKLLEIQLQHAQKMEALGTLAGGIAHNFNNLLMGIQGNASLILLETDPAHPNYNRLKGIEQSVQSGSNLTSQLLSYAREEKYEIRPLNINHLLEETSKTFAATKREIRVHRDLWEGIQGILADQGQIEQVLLNLYINAADAMPRGGDLFLKTVNATHKDMSGKPYKVKHGDYILVTVRDTGVGMDEETMERIFEPFFTTKGLAKGTGLGLASVYGIIKAHGGYIEVDSHKGGGTTFSIYLPASKSKPPDVRVPSVGIATGTETVLLVDDEEMILEVGTQMLEALGYKVVIARSGREAIELVKRAQRLPSSPDLLILDMIMPDMGGKETLEHIREVNPDIKVLLSSGYSIDGQAKEIMEKGCDGFIQKPFDIKELSHKVREILDTH